MKVFSQLEKAQLENTTSDTGSLPKGMITYRTDLNIAKVSNGTSMLALIDESSTQTLSGKTYASPITTGAIQGAQIATPANPSAGNNKLYFKSDGKLYTLDSSGNEAAVGSGTGGVKNLITNGNADDTASSIFVPYADTGTRPVGGTGGSPTVTTSITTTTPLDGVKSFLLTKPASNVQGQGWAVPFTVDPAYRAKSLKISVDYIVNSGTFVAGGAGVESDVIWYIYDVTNSQLIEPSNIKMLSNSSTISDKFEATFQTSATGASYRLIAHCQSTSELAYELKVDNVTVSPQVYVFGTPVTDWQSYTPSTGATNTTYNGKWRRVGDTMEVTVGFAFTGAPSTWGSVHIPTGYTIDTSKMGGFAQYGSNIGEGMVYDTAGQAQPFHVTYFSTTQVLFVYEAPTSNQITPCSNTAPYTLGNTDIAQVRFYVPIVGWSSSVQMSDAADTRVMAASIRLDIARSIPNTTATKINFQSSGMLFDTHGAFDYTNDRYIAQMTGKFKFSGWVGFDTNASGIREISYKKNGGASQYVSSVPSFGTYTQSVPYSFLEDLNAGDYIEVYVFQSSGAALNLFANGSVLNVEKISGPSQIAASELVGMSYENTAGTSITTSNSTITFATKNFDTHNAYSGGVFTAPIAGKYFVSVNMFSVTTLSNTAGWYAKIVKNGSTNMLVNTKAGTGAPNTTNCVAVSGIVELKAGDTLRVDSNLDAAGPISLTASAGYNVFTISRVGM